MAASPKSTKAKARPVAPRPALQWLAAAVGLGVTLASAGIILAEAMGPVRPAVLTARVDQAHRTPAGWVFDVTVENAGSETAAGVEIVGVVGSETASATLDYVPGDGEAEASLAFSDKTGGARPSLSVAGWARP